MKKKGNFGIGLVIIALGFLFLIFGSSFVESSTKHSNTGVYYNSTSGSNYLLELHNLTLGRQRIAVESYPNLEVGSPEEKDVVFQSSSIKLLSNFLTKTDFEVRIPVKPDECIEYLLFYTSPDIESLSNDVIVTVNNDSVYVGRLDFTDIPILIPVPNNVSGNVLTVKVYVDKPRFFQVWKWNSLYLKNNKIVEVVRKKDNSEQSFRFYVLNPSLESLYVNLLVDCADSERGSTLEVLVNNYSLSKFSFDCEHLHNSKTISVPLNIVGRDNKITFRTDGYLKFSYNIKKVFFNDKFVYTFNLNNYNDIVDVVVRGDFDKETIDIKVNGHLMELDRNEIKSILPYLRIGVNQIEFLSKPLDIKEFYVEKVDWYYDED